MLAFALAVRAIVRLVRDTDEFLRKSMLEQLAIAAAGTAGITFTYGFLEMAGFSQLSMFIVWPLMGALWVGASVAPTAPPPKGPRSEEHTSELQSQANIVC